MAIGGYRVELAEIEDALRAHPGIVSAAACLRRGGRDSPQLTAYIVTRPGGGIRAAELRAALGASFPDRLVPRVYGFVDELPRRPDGGIDRDRLAEIEPVGAPDPGGPPANEVERRLAEIWAEVLGRNPEGRDEEFSALGGDPAAAERIADAVSVGFGVELAPRDLARAPTVAAMADRLERLGGEGIDGSRIPRVPRNGPLPCSLAQERIWPLSSHPGNVITTENRLRGPLSVAAMRAALEDLVRAHEMLRTTFVERDGVPLQVIHPPTPLDIPLINLGPPDPDARARELVRQQSEESLDLEHGPLIQMRLLRVAEDDHRVVRTIHHLLSDRASGQIFFRDLARAYEARLRGGEPFSLGDRPQYADFAVWERARLRSDGRRYQREVKWWRRQLEPERAPQPLPFERVEPNPEAVAEEGAIEGRIEDEVSLALDEVSRPMGATFYASRLAVFAALLGLETGVEEVQLGSYASNRRAPEAQSMFGFFTNPISLIIPFEPRLSFRGWLARVMTTVADAGARRQVPYEHLCEELRRSGAEPPELRALFQVYDRWDVEFGDLVAEPSRYLFPGMPWGFSFVMDPSRGRCASRFDPRIYDPDGVCQFLERYWDLAARVAARPDRPLGQLALG